MRLIRGSGLVLAATLASCGGDDPAPPGVRATPAATATAERGPADGRDALRRLERRFDARLGVYALDTGSGREVAHRAGERFPVTSTFKALAAGAMLREYGLEGLSRTVPIAQLTTAYSPVTERRVGTRMSLKELCAAAVRHSDNMAANLLTPAPRARSRGTCARAAAPDGATVGDKTGTGATYGARNDIAVVWPRGRAPIVLAVLSTRRDADAEPDDELIARAASAAFAALG